MIFENLSFVCSSDDRAEEAEAADWPSGTPSAHERQPPAACIRVNRQSPEAAQHRLRPNRVCPHSEVTHNVYYSECECNL